MTSILTNSRERTRFIKFSVVGFIGTIVDFGVMNLLVTVFSASLVFAGTVSFITAVISNFLWNRYWTYPDSRSKTFLKQLTEFFIVSIVGLAIRIPTLAVLEPVVYGFISKLPFDIPLFPVKFLADNITLALSIILVMFWNFFVNRYWTYGDVE
jgi:putative flippase GtrA